MANRFLRNREILKYAENYYKIINEEFEIEDKISNKIIELYRDYIFSTKTLSEKMIDKIKKIDKIVYKYFEDFEFKKELSKGIISIRVSKNEENILEYIIDNLINIYDKYLESYTRNIYIPKWI